jgi:hypothetical protein
LLSSWDFLTFWPSPHLINFAVDLPARFPLALALPLELFVGRAPRSLSVSGKSLVRKALPLNSNGLLATFREKAPLRKKRAFSEKTPASDGEKIYDLGKESPGSQREAFRILMRKLQMASGKNFL